MDTSGPFSDFVVEMDINDTGTIAFLGLLDAGGGGVFTGPNPATDKMLVVGDTLFGSTITDLGLSFGAINNSGQISFVYTLANGVTGVAVATPVPEPALLWPLLIAASAIALRPSKRRPDSALS